MPRRADLIKEASRNCRSVFELGVQPLEQLPLVRRCRAAHLNQQFVEVRALQCDVGRAFVANRADRFQVARFIAATQAFIDDVPNVQSGFARGIVGVRLTGHSAAHLACEAVAVQHKGSGFLGNASRESRLRL